MHISISDCRYQVKKNRETQEQEFLQKEEEMNKRNDVAVVIGGEVYNLSGYESEEYMQKIASYLNAKRDEMRLQPGYSQMKAELRDILIQINIADDYFKIKRAQEETSGDATEKYRENVELRRELIGMQTRVEAAKGYYLRFLSSLPDIAALAESSEETCLKLWEGLG